MRRLFNQIVAQCLDFVACRSCHLTSDLAGREPVPYHWPHRFGALPLVSPTRRENDDASRFLPAALTWLCSILDARQQRERPHRRCSVVCAEGSPELVILRYTARGECAALSTPGFQCLRSIMSHSNFQAEMEFLPPELVLHVLGGLVHGLCQKHGTRLQGTTIFLSSLYIHKPCKHARCLSHMRCISCA